MNARTLVLIGAIALVGIGAIMMLGDFFAPKSAPAQLTPAMALTQIQPYTVITQDMVAQGETMAASSAQKAGMWQVRDVVGRMSTDLIAPGTILTTRNVLPIEDVRFTTDPNLEIVSFTASVDKMVAGKIKPGALVNLYGFGRQGDTNEPFTVLVEPKVWVVAVTSGGSAVSNATLVPDSKTGALTRTGGDQERPGTTLTVAVAPEKAYKIIDSFGAQGLSAWVTLAANQSVAGTGLATPLPPATATPGLPFDVALTATALYNAIKATVPASGPATGDGWGAGR